MPDLTLIHQRIKNAFEKDNIFISNRYIGLVALRIHEILPDNELAAFIEPGPPPAGRPSGVPPIYDSSPEAYYPADWESGIVAHQRGAAGTREGK